MSEDWLQLNQKYAIVSLQVINKSCFNGKGALWSLGSNNKKATVFNVERWRLFKVAETSIGYNKIKN